MPLATAPNLIELADFSAGWHPDLEASAVPPNGLLEVMNLLPDIGSGTLETRKGYDAFTSAIDDGFTVRTMVPYERTVGTTKGQFIMLVATNEDDNTSNNVRVYRVRLSDGDVTRVSDTGLTFPTSTGRHWGATINGTYYGGGDGLPMYSWNPDDGFNDDPSDQNYDVLVDVEDGAPTAGQVGSDYAFENRQEVLYTDSVTATQHAYSAAKKNRFKPWKKGTEYEKGDFVSVKTTITGKGNHMRSYKATEAHTATTVNKPSAGAGHPWKLVELSLPRDEEGEISEDWNLIPTAAVTNLAMWHAERLWLRWDNLSATGKKRVQYSAPSKPVKGDDTGQLEWDPRDFRVGDSLSGEGEGGGWLPDFIEDVTAMYSFGYYGLFFTRTQVKVLAGVNENTWVFRDLAPVGAIGPHAVTEHDGLVYFISDRGFQMTDGTQVQEAPGGERIREWLREAVDWETGGIGNDINMWSFGGFVWCSLPTGKGRRPDTTLVYDPVTKSFWLLDLPIAAAAVARISGTDQLFFTKDVKSGEVAEFGSTYAWTGTAHRSSSTRVLAAVTRTNLCTNPQFHPVHDAVVTTSGIISGAKAGWAVTHANGVTFKVSTLAGRGGGAGMVSGAEVSVVKTSDIMRGIEMDLADVDTSVHTASIYVRRSEWKKNPKVDYSIVRFALDGTDVAENKHTYTKVGRGWVRVEAEYTGAASSRSHQWLVKGGATVHMDQAMFYDGDDTLPYFDGNGGAALVDHVTTGEDGGIVYQYDHPNVKEEPSDDGEPIAWGMRTAWLPFGVLREERRIRRVWSLVRGVAEVTLYGYRNFSDEAVFEAVEAPSDVAPAQHLEGLSMPDGYAVSISVQGVFAPSAVLGVSLDTQPRRIRYHS